MCCFSSTESLLLLFSHLNFRHCWQQWPFVSLRLNRRVPRSLSLSRSLNNGATIARPSRFRELFLIFFFHLRMFVRTLTTSCATDKRFYRNSGSHRFLDCADQPPYLWRRGPGTLRLKKEKKNYLSIFYFFKFDLFFTLYIYKHKNTLVHKLHKLHYST